MRVTDPLDPPKASTWTQRPERSSMAVLRLMTWLSLRLGRRASRPVLYLIAAYFVLFAPAAKRASKDYLRRVLGRPATIRDGFRHVLTFATVIHDRVYWLCDRPGLFDVQVQGDELLAGYRRAGRGIVLMGAHFGSFEALRMLGDRHGLDVRMLMYTENAKMVTQTLAAINPSVKDHVIALGRGDALLRVRDHLDAGGCVGILADRSLKDDQGKVRHVEFIGDPAPFPIGPFRLAALLQAPVVFMAGSYLGGNRYHLCFEPIADFHGIAPAEREIAIEQAVQRFAALLQERCQAAPWNWFNFYDFWNASHD